MLSRHRIPSLYALITALLIGGSAPFTKLLLGGTGPFALAALISLGSGSGALLFFLVGAVAGSGVTRLRLRPGGVTSPGSSA